MVQNKTQFRTRLIITIVNQFIIICVDTAFYHLPWFLFKLSVPLDLSTRILLNVTTRWVMTTRKKATNKQFRLLQKKLFIFCRRVKNIAAFGEKRTGGITRAFLRVPEKKARWNEKEAAAKIYAAAACCFTSVIVLSGFFGKKLAAFGEKRVCGNTPFRWVLLRWVEVARPTLHSIFSTLNLASRKFNIYYLLLI